MIPAAAVAGTPQPRLAAAAVSAAGVGVTPGVAHDGPAVTASIVGVGVGVGVGLGDGLALRRLVGKALGDALRAGATYSSPPRSPPDVEATVGGVVRGGVGVSWPVPDGGADEVGPVVGLGFGTDGIPAAARCRIPPSSG